MTAHQTSQSILPAGTHIGQVRLRVTDMDRALAFYHTLLGYHVFARDNGVARVSDPNYPESGFVLSEQPGARRNSGRTAGLYHAAILLPSHRDLARMMVHLVDQEWPLGGAADHGVSEAIYLADPDGNGLEIYADRPRETWPRQSNGRVAMKTDPLDVNGLVAEIGPDPEPWQEMPTNTTIGHIHLQVSNLRRSADFYTNVLGFEITQDTYPGALFVSAGGYHHHIGLNTWAGEGIPPTSPDSAGLMGFRVVVPDRASWEAALDRVRSAGLTVSDQQTDSESDSVVVKDPDSNEVEISFSVSLEIEGYHTVALGPA